MEKHEETLSRIFQEMSMSKEEARALISKKNPLPPAAEKVFGNENVQDLLDLLYDPELAELDEIAFTGELSAEEHFEYVAHLDEYNQLQIRAIQLAESFVEFVRSKLKYYLDHTIRDNGRINPRGRLVTLLELIENMSSSQELPYHSYRNRILVLFGMVFSSHLFGYLYTTTRTDRQEIGFRQYINALTQVYNQTASPLLSGILTCNEAALLHTYIEQYRRSIVNLFACIKEKEDISEINELLFQEIDEMAYFRRIECHIKDIVGVRIAIIPNPDHKIMREVKTQVISHVRIIADPRVSSDFNLDFVPFEMAGGNIAFKIDREKNQGFVDLTLNKATGELCFFTSQIPITHVMGKEAYQKLKYHVLNVLHEYLSSGEEDFDKLLLSESDQSLLEVKEDEEITAPFRDQIVELAPDLIEKKDNIESPLTIEERGEIEDAIRKKYRRAWEQCRQKKDDIFRALVRILGSPVRQSGSHCTFKSRDGQGIFALPKGKDIIGVGMLKTCLERLQISPVELVDYL